MRSFVRRLLDAAGIDAVYGRPLGDLAVVPVADIETATLLAAAHRRVHGASAVAHVGDGVLVAPPLRSAADPAAGDPTAEPADGGPTARGPAGATGRGPARAAPGGPARPPAAATPAGGAAVIGPDDDGESGVAALVGLLAGTHDRVRLDVDPHDPRPDAVVRRPAPADGWVDPGDDAVATLAAAAAPVVLAGPGVVDDGAVPGLHALAAAASVGVLNTWGAKGVFDWRSRHHLATGGLQARDFELGGLGEADVVIATGIDPAEAPSDRWRHLATVVEVAPRALDPLAERWARPAATVAMPPLREGLAAVTQAGWQAAAAPIAPSRATLHHAQALAGGGLVAADAGMAGFWVARTFGTTELGAVHVPAVRRPGFAAACAVVARLRRPGRPVLAVVDGPPDARSTAVQEAGAALGVAVPIEAWAADGPPLDPDAHRRRLDDLVAAERPVTAPLAVDVGQLDRMVDVAGPVVAWGGLG